MNFVLLAISLGYRQPGSNCFGAISAGALSQRIYNGIVSVSDVSQHNSIFDHPTENSACQVTALVLPGEPAKDGLP